MKRYMLWAIFGLVPVALALTANLATVQGPLTTVCTTDTDVPDGLCVESSGTAGWPARAASSGLLPCLHMIPSRPVVAGSPAVSLAPDGTTFGLVHAYAPADICAAYGVDRLHKKGITGKGQTIVLVEYWGSPTALEDLQVFSRTFGLPDPDLTIIYPDGKPTLNTADKVSWALETSLDLQWAHAIAPDAKLVCIAANSSLCPAIAQAVQNYPGSVISQSFGDAEQRYLAAAEPAQASVNPLIAQHHRLYEQAVAAGCTVLAASGDWGTANFDFQGRTYPSPTVWWPASDPLVTAVGGTQLQWGWEWTPNISADEFWAELAANGWNWAAYNSAFLDSVRASRSTEAVWNEAWLPMATGGGLSALFPTPDFQSGLPQSLLQGRRGVPDISWNAAMNGGVMIYMTANYAGIPSGDYVGGWSDVFGTSAGTPQIAGLVALANQLRAQRGKGPIGYLNPVLYTLPASDFNDIVPETFAGLVEVTLDDNELYGLGVPGFETTPGYDLTTGLGSPKAYEFVHDLADAP